MARRGDEAPVADQKRRAERFESDTDGIAGREIAPQLPDAGRRNSCGYRDWNNRPSTAAAGVQSSASSKRLDVHNDHWRLRSARITAEGVICVRRSKRARSSPSVGLSATWRISPSK